MSADNDKEKQNQQVNDILDEGIDVLVLDPANRFSAAGGELIACKNILY